MKVWFIIIIVVLVSALGWQYHKASRWRNAHDANQAEIRLQQRRLERLAAERDSIINMLHLREMQYLAATDSLNIAISHLHLRQTQNRKQYENTRHRVVAMPGDELYRFVSDYIGRYADSLQP